MIIVKYADFRSALLFRASRDGANTSNQPEWVTWPGVPGHGVTIRRNMSNQPEESAAQIGQRKILVLHGKNAQPNDLLQHLAHYAQIITVNNVDEALEQLKQHDFSAVLSETADFLPLERAAVNQQASAILNTIGEGVCIVATDGTILWANRQMENFGDTVKQNAAHHCQDACLHFQKRLGRVNLDPADLNNLLRPRRYSITEPESNRYFEMISTPMLNPEAKLTHVAAVLWEATASRRLQQRLDAIDKAGKTPLPPYIKREPVENDRERYQTVYAKERGSVAAPTAGLHFSPGVLDKLASSGIARASVTLHVGLGTFRPLSDREARQSRLHSEYCIVPASTVRMVKACRKRGGHVFAVGTTTARALETASVQGEIAPFEGWTDIFIKPPYSFRSVDCLLTNFHLPRSSLLLLVCAFAGKERILTAYNEAVKERYRFYSYGDAMLIL